MKASNIRTSGGQCPGTATGDENEFSKDSLWPETGTRRNLSVEIRKEQANYEKPYVSNDSMSRRFGYRTFVLERKNVLNRIDGHDVQLPVVDKADAMYHDLAGTASLNRSPSSTTTSRNRTQRRKHPI